MAAWHKKEGIVIYLNFEMRSEMKFSKGVNMKKAI